MSAHISDELPRMLTGESNRDAVLSAAEHLRTCVDCQHELVSAVVAHASLTSAQRFAPEIVSGMFTGNFADTERTETAEEGSSGDAAVDDADPKGMRDERAEFVLPDLSAMFAQVRQEAAAKPRRTVGPPRHLSRMRYVVGGAAAAVLLGSGAAAYVATSGHDSAPAKNATGIVQLAAFDAGKTAGSAKINGTEVSIDASTLPHMNGKRYEVWLTNDARTKMQPVGWLGANGTAAMTVPADLLARYQDIEVSVQKVDAKDYLYSGTSVLRGSIE